MIHKLKILDQTVTDSKILLMLQTLTLNIITIHVLRHSCPLILRFLLFNWAPNPLMN
jgi:hypothetical protein